jgi:arsenite-transporting ATPase
VLLKGFAMEFLEPATRYLFFTGKGGVGKTSTACATAIVLADRGKRVLLVSTDPASNLDEVLGTRLGSAPTAVRGVPGLFALNINPEAAAKAYRERMVGPYRGVLPREAVASIEEQLSGACTVEIAAFDEFSKLLGDAKATAGFDHVIFDTAPTGHTLRLLSLPAAWSNFLESNVGGSSCLGPLAGLKSQQALYEASRHALTDLAATTLIIVSRPEREALAEAERTSRELKAQGVVNQHLVLNGLFRASDKSDPIAREIEARAHEALKNLSPTLASLPRTELPLLPFNLVGIDALRAFARPGTAQPLAAHCADGVTMDLTSLFALIPEIARPGRGIVMTMGKGGVGKTTVAGIIAVELARQGHRVHLTTTDPAGRELEGNIEASGLRVSRIDPETETRAYAEEVMRTAGSGLDAQGRALLEEDLNSPCTQEIAVFRAFARLVAEGEEGFVVIDTAPTGHTLLLLDAAQAYHREVLRSLSNVPDAVRNLLPRLRDPDFTKVLIVTLPEATPVHEAEQLQSDLARAGIRPFAWVLNQSLTPLAVSDRVLAMRRLNEGRHLEEVCRLASRAFVLPWMRKTTFVRNEAAEEAHSV